MGAEGFFCRRDPRNYQRNGENGCDMKILQREDVVQFLKFGIVGISNTLISLAVYYVFLWIDARLYLVGNVAGWIVSVANAFCWSNKFVFASENNSRKDILIRLGKTYLSYGATFLISTILLYVEVDVLNWPAALCPILNLLITIPANFLLNKFWAFR